MGGDLRGHPPVWTARLPLEPNISHQRFCLKGPTKVMLTFPFGIWGLLLLSSLFQASPLQPPLHLPPGTPHLLL